MRKIVIAPTSLEALRDQLEQSLLNTCIEIYKLPSNPLRHFGWIGDLRYLNLIEMAKGAAPLWKVDPDEVYEMGGFLFDAERALFAGFRDSEIRMGALVIARSLVEKGVQIFILLGA